MEGRLIIKKKLSFLREVDDDGIINFGKEDKLKIKWNDEI
jgi:hypothetical protein